MLLKSVFSGFGGQGVLMMGYVLAWAGVKDNRHVTFLPAYGAEVRGGTANCTVVVSDEEIASPIASHPEYVVAMNYPSLVKYQDALKEDGVMFLNKDLISEDPSRNGITLVKVPANSIAHEMGNDRVLNMVMLGAFIERTKAVSQKAAAEAVVEVLGEKKQKLIDINQRAMEKGAQFVANL
jgi:2-oxoglutarate ferredoxin oxidoreductase subunit gamma